MNIDSIKNGYVIDHIEAGKSMQIYKILDLNNVDASVAILKNVKSKKSKDGKKDIIKIDRLINLNLDVLAFISPNITVNVIKNSERVEKRHLELPEELINIIKCKNPRCITSIERELDHIFNLTDRENKVYRCKYCETMAKIDQE